MKPLLLARFTPSLMAPEDLESIFVQREPLAERLLSQIEESLTTANKHHTLLVGPRGIGKTHLVTLIHHRLVNRPDLRSRCIIAWLREEEWGVMSFLDLLLRILRSLADNGEGEVPKDRLDALHDLSPAEAETKAANLLRDVIGNKTLVLLIENLNDIFQGLDAREQGAFRAFVQDHACMTILATTPGLFNEVSSRKSPFFGFFRIHHLQELSFEDAAQLLHKIAVRKGQDDLAAFMLSPIGRARIRAIHHLAQGNPRVYIILSEFLTRESLDELLNPVLRMLDDLTPYYQARLASLSTQQRKLVEFLASYRIPCTVKEIARQCFVSQQTASAQLRKLAQWGYVRSENVGRESYYELREPLMRFCLDLKKERKEPLRPLVEILRIWWTPDDLEDQLYRLAEQISPTTDYLAKALEICRSESKDPRVKACKRDFDSYMESGQHTKALEAAEEWVAVSKDAESLFQFGRVNAELERWEVAWKALLSASELAPENFYVGSLSASVAVKRREFAEAVNIATRVLGFPDCGEPAELRLALFRVKVMGLIKLRRFEEAEKTLLGASKTLFDSNDYFLLAAAQDRLGRKVEALANLQKSIAGGGGVLPRLLKARILALEDRWEEVLQEIKEAVGASNWEIDRWTQTMELFASLAMLSGRNGRSFLIALNQLLNKHGLSPIRVSHLMAFVSKSMIDGHDSVPARRLSHFFTQLSSMPTDDHALNIAETAMEYFRGEDASVLLRLPFEERQLIEALIADDSSEGPWVERSDEIAPEAPISSGT